MDYIDNQIQFEEFEEFDAFGAGVQPGGLRNKNEIKILVCYMIKTLDQPITKNQLIDVVQGQGLANYFELTQAISELLSQGSITTKMIDDVEHLCVTEMGKQVSVELETDIPKSVKEKAIRSAVKMLTIAKNERENNIDIIPADSGSGFYVSFTMEDETDIMMQLSVYVADREQAEMLKKNFLTDPTRVYSTILSSLMVE